MEMTGEYPIAAPRQKVWEALNDAETLKACIPGCETLTKTSDTSFEAKVKARVGPVSATFTGAVTLQDLNPPISYTIAGEGKGGVAGFAKGGAKVALEELSPTATQLKYEVKAQVGGKLAQIGARLIDGTAKKLADEFFANFAARVGASAIPAEDHAHGDHAHGDHAHDEHGHAAPPAGLSDAALNKDVGAGVSTGVWVTGLIIVVLLLLAVFGLGGGDSGH